MSGEHGLAGVADAGAFLARLVRYDRSALVRLRSVSGRAGEPHVELWGRLPWEALVTRVVVGHGPGDATGPGHGPGDATVPGHGPGDATVAATDLLAALAAGDTALPARRDASWRWPLPPRPGRVVEAVDAADLVRVDGAAAGTLRDAVTGRRVGERLIRDALLDHIAIIVTDVDAVRVDVPQRLVQAILRMGFLGPSGDLAGKSVGVRIAGKWTGLTAPFGTAWLREVNELAVRSLRIHTNG